MANSEHVELVKKGAEAIARWRKANPEERLDLAGADLSESNLDNASLSSSNLIGTNMRGSSSRFVDFRWAAMNGADLRGAILNEAVFTGARLTEVDFREATLIRARMEGVGGVLSHYPAEFDAARGQESVVLDRSLGLCWEVIRKVGSLPLFGVSYFALIAIWIWAVTVRFYNAQIAAVRAWATEHVADTDPQQWLASLILKLNKVDLSESLGASFTAVLLLAAAATVYKIACPGEIQENSRQRWVHQLGKPLLQYRFLARVGVVWRWITAVLYAVAIPWVLWVVAQRIWETYEIFLGG